MDENCIFCKIAKKEIPSNMVYEDEYVCAFYDLNPVAPVHVLVIPKIHIQDLESVDEDNAQYLMHIQLAFKKISKIVGLDKKGYRVICNCGEDAGQEVKHLHYHMIGGKKIGTKIIND